MRLSDRIKYSIYMVLLYPLALLPLRALYVLSDLLYLLVRAIKYRRKVVRRNIETSFSEKSEAERLSIEHGFYRHLCDIVVETVKLLHCSEKFMRRHIEVTGTDAVDEVARRRGCVVLYLGHYGNWEWVPATRYWFHSDMEAYHIYKPLRDAAADRLMLRLRSALPSVGIPQAKALRTILGLRHRGNPFLVGFIADQRSNSENTHLRVDFLNHLTPVNTGGETIGEKVGADYFYLDVTLQRRGHYIMRYIPIKPAADGTLDHPYTRRYMDLLQDNIRRQPSLWLWSHRRWLYK